MSVQKLFDQTLAYCVDFATKLLEEQGGFYPFGCSVDANGQLGAFGAMAGDNPNPSEIYMTLVGSFRVLARDHKITAAAIAIDVNIRRNLSLNGQMASALISKRSKRRTKPTFLIS